MSEMKDRIREVRKDSKMTQPEFSKTLGMSEQATKFWEGGYRQPTGAVVELICEKFHVNKEWLMTGKGEKYVIQKESAPIGREQEVAEIVTSIMTGASDDLRLRLIKAITKLTPEQIAELKDFVLDLAEAAKK